MTESNPVHFPCDSLPENASEARLLGIYPQRQEGLFMQRVKTVSGCLTLEQWQGLAELATKFTPDYPLHATTRQNLELHGVRKEDLPAVQHGIAALGLTGAAACGDGVRSITVCPRGDSCPGAWETGDLVAAIRSAVESLPWRESLPRKFKISVSGCEKACGRPYINDLGLAVNADGTFRVILAGSLGPKPDLGLLVYDALPLEDVVPLVVAVLRLFHAEGDRTNRSRARLRHVRQRLGEEAFRSCVKQLLQVEKRQGEWPVPVLRRAEAAVPLSERLCLPLGDIMPEMVLEMVEAVRAAGGELRLGMCHDLLIFAEAQPKLSPRLAALRGKGSVVACPGVTWCTRGVVDARAAACRVRSALPGTCELLVGITGCPNNCTQAATADIGLIARPLRVGEERVDGFRLFAGGGKGETSALAEELHPGLPTQRVHEAVSWLAEEYQNTRNGSELSMSDFIAASAGTLREELTRRFGA